MLSFEDLIKAPTAKEIEQTIYDTLASVGVVTSSWKPGAVVRAIVTGVSRIGGVLGGGVSLLARSAALDTSDGDWLTFLAWEMYRVERIPGGFAEGDVVLTNVGAGFYTIQPGDLIVATPTGETFRNVEVFTLTPGSTATVRVRALTMGSANSAVPGTITTLVSTLIGVTCTNPLALNGIDVQGDESLRRSCRQKLATLSSGLLADAMVYNIEHATRADGPNKGENYGVSRVEVQPADGYGSCIVYGATASGAVPAGDVVEIQTIMDRYTFPYTGCVDFRSATPKPVNAACTVWVKSGGLTADEVKGAVTKAISKHVVSLPIGGQVTTGPSGFVSWRSLLGAIEGADSGIIEAKLVSELNIPMSAEDVAMNATPATDITVVIV